MPLPPGVRKVVLATHLSLSVGWVGAAAAYLANGRLFRHYWVIFSSGLTSFATVVLLLHMPTVSSTADDARAASPEQLEALGGDVGHPAIGLVVLIATLVLNVYKPPGTTPHGQRRQAARHGEPVRGS